MLTYKNIDRVVNDVDMNTRMVTGYFSSFDTLDSDNDIIRKGFYAKSIRENGPGTDKDRIMHLYQHDVLMPLGKPKTLTEDATGLYFETPIVKTSYGDDVLKLYEAGIFEHSVGIEVIRANKNDNGERELLEGKLWEGSTVTWGANENTPFMGFKSAEPARVLDRIDKISKALRNGTFTDETFIQLEYQLQQIKKWASELTNPPAAEPEKLTDAPDDSDDLALITLIRTQIQSL